MSKKRNYLASIDSLRAIAVISVIIYHLSSSYLPGGFLGVDLFFVLSGYLISSLIMQEYQETSKLDLKEFYIRRSRRLLPAVYFMISVFVIFMVIFNKYALEKSYLDAVFSYVYSSNWWYIVHQVDYFDSFATSPFKHLWSLAIEEQFYFFFPVIFLLIQFINKKFGGKIKYPYVIGALIIISLLSHIFLYDENNVNRVYYGTDTRTFALLIGVLGAYIYPMSNLKLEISRKEKKLYSLTSATSLIIFVVSMFFISETSMFMYRGGFFVYSVLFLIMIISTAKQKTLMSFLMSFKPLVFIGKISYSLYLWHFPIIVLLSPGMENTYLRNIILLVLIFSAAIFSYRFIESPIRREGFINFVKSRFLKLKTFKENIRRSILVTSFILFVFLFMGIFGKSLPYVSTLFVKDTRVELADNFQTNVEEVKTEVNKENTENQNTKYSNILLLGDSLAVNIGQSLSDKYPGALVDGQVSRQANQMLEIVPSYSSYNNSASAVIYIMGTNGTITEEQLDKMIKAFENADVYFLNVNVPRVWQDSNNKLLEESKSKYSNLTVIDWKSLAESRPDYFAADRVHLNQAGIDGMLNLISVNLKKEVETSKMIEIKQAEEKEKAEAAKQEEKQKQVEQTQTSN